MLAYLGAVAAPFTVDWINGGVQAAGIAGFWTSVAVWAVVIVVIFGIVALVAISMIIENGGPPPGRDCCVFGSWVPKLAKPSSNLATTSGLKRWLKNETKQRIVHLNV